MTHRFTVHHTPLAGLTLVERHRRSDDRGFLSRLYCANDLVSAGFQQPIAQINQTLTRRRGTVRGLHFQHPPYAEDKFISVLHGAVFDVAVDLRATSPTFLRWHGVILSEENEQSLFIPKGFAHGFQTIVEDCELLYLHTMVYHPPAEDVLNALDPRIDIGWPLDVTDISHKDAAARMIDYDFSGINP